MAKPINQAIGGVIQIVILLITIILGLFAYRYVKNSNAQQQQDQQNAADFKKRGLFASLGDYLLGTPKDTSSTDTGSSADKSGGQTNDTQALADALAQEQKLQNELKASDALAQQLNEQNTNKTTGAPQTQEQNTNTARNAVQHEISNPSELFNRTSPDVSIFKTKYSVTSPTGTDVQDFAYFNKTPVSREQALAIKENAIKQATDAGFKVPKGVAPITVLTSSPERINRFASQLEASQQRRLGLRKAGEPLVGTPVASTTSPQSKKPQVLSAYEALFGGLFG